jgi:hypothetical protein
MPNKWRRKNRDLLDLNKYSQAKEEDAATACQVKRNSAIVQCFTRWLPEMAASRNNFRYSGEPIKSNYGLPQWQVVSLNLLLVAKVKQGKCRGNQD